MYIELEKLIIDVCGTGSRINTGEKQQTNQAVVDWALERTAIMFQILDLRKEGESMERRKRLLMIRRNTQKQTAGRASMKMRKRRTKIRAESGDSEELEPWQKTNNQLEKSWLLEKSLLQNEVYRLKRKMGTEALDPTLEHPLVQFTGMSPKDVASRSTQVVKSRQWLLKMIK